MSEAVEVVKRLVGVSLLLLLLVMSSRRDVDGRVEWDLDVVEVGEGGQGRPEAARRGSLDGPVVTGVENVVPSRSRLGGGVVEDALRCGLQFPIGVWGASRPGSVAWTCLRRSPTMRGRAWSGAAQPAVLNHILTTARVMPIHEPVCWLRPSVTLSRRTRGSGSRRRVGRSRRG